MQTQDPKLSSSLPLVICDFLPLKACFQLPSPKMSSLSGADATGISDESGASQEVNVTCIKVSDIKVFGYVSSL